MRKTTKTKTNAIELHLPVKGEPVAQIATVTSTQTVEQSVSESGAWSDGALTFAIVMARKGSITALVVAECVPLAHLVDGFIGGRVLTGLMSFRVVIDGRTSSPESGCVRGITQTAFRETRSFLAVIEGLPAGRHAVAFQWRNEPGAGTPAFPAQLGPRSLTVWSTAQPRPGTQAPDVP